MAMLIEKAPTLFDQPITHRFAQPWCGFDVFVGQDVQEPPLPYRHLITFSDGYPLGFAFLLRIKSP